MVLLVVPVLILPSICYRETISAVVAVICKAAQTKLRPCSRCREASVNAREIGEYARACRIESARPKIYDAISFGISGVEATKKCFVRNGDTRIFVF